ncbi:twin-arginine translocase TatA/TatE family subunit [Thermophilibacter provencensis]|uniref:twin-arginine translocase TatA/TatE family subunit n=1 Tax=Thermophilibacter provencensis TaxID=1852386 RepID=UPI003AA8A1FD
MFGIGEGELLLIVLFAFMIFGPDKLPGMGRTLGRALRQFRNAQEGFTEVVQTNIVDPAAEAISDTPKKPNRNRAAELEEDADIEAPEGEGAPAPRRAETFAERKKRLAAEKAAREEAEKAAAAAAEETGDDAVAPAGSAAKEPATPASAPSKPSAADLYAMHRPSRPAEPAGADAEPSLDATREASEERSDERGAAGADPSVAGPATTSEKEA